MYSRMYKSRGWEGAEPRAKKPFIWHKGNFPSAHQSLIAFSIRQVTMTGEVCPRTKYRNRDGNNIPILQNDLKQTNKKRWENFTWQIDNSETISTSTVTHQMNVAGLSWSLRPWPLGGVNICRSGLTYTDRSQINCLSAATDGELLFLIKHGSYSILN